MHEPLNVPCPRCSEMLEYNFEHAWNFYGGKPSRWVVPPKQAEVFHGRTVECPGCKSTVTLAVECAVHVIVMKDGVENEHAKETRKQWQKAAD